MIREIVAGCSLCLVGTAASAQGAFDFDAIAGLSDEPLIEINVDATAMAWARNFLRAADPQSAEVLEGLRGMKLRVYHAASNARQFNSFMEKVDDELLDDGWRSVMSMQNADSSVRLHMRMTETDVEVLTLMFFDGMEAVFLSIDGSVSASDLGTVMAAFNQGSLLNGLVLPGVPAPAPGPTPPVPAAAE